MIIKIIPETAEEKKSAKEIKHVGVKDFFFCGNKKDGDALSDFHDWHGSYRFLEGSLLYFSNIIKEERQTKERSKGREIELAPQAETKSPFIKTGEVGNIQVVNTEPIEETMGEVISVPFRKIEGMEEKEAIITAEELPVDDEDKTPEDQAGEDR